MTSSDDSGIFPRGVLGKQFRPLQPATIDRRQSSSQPAAFRHVRLVPVTPHARRMKFRLRFRSLGVALLLVPITLHAAEVSAWRSWRGTSGAGLAPPGAK